MQLINLIDRLIKAEPRPGLHPIPGTTPLTLEAAICPPLIYYIALLFLPPSPPHSVDTTAVKLLRNGFALLAGLLFLRLPLAYHVPQSIGLTYQLGLVGLYGSARVLDVFFISPYLFGHIPRRVRYKHESRVGTPILDGLRDVKSSEGRIKPRAGTSSGDGPGEDALAPRADPRTTEQDGLGLSATDLLDNVKDALPTSLDESYHLLHCAASGPNQKPVIEHAVSEDGWPHNFHDRASWALELELSMRGVGFTWSTADVRHTRKTWLPTVHSRLHSIFAHVGPVLVLCFFLVRTIYLRYGLQDVDSAAWGTGTGADREDLFDTRLPFPVQILLTTALGAFLMTAFSFAHSAFAIMLSPLAPHPLAYFPPLYTTRIWDIKSVRQFWSYGWHRLFARFFLVYGIWPCEWIERKLTGKRADQPADVGKVLGGFLSSAFCHSFAVRGVLGGEWARATGEAKFFAVNGVAVVVEEVVKRAVLSRRKRAAGGDGTLDRWYDGYVGRIWWICVLLLSGRNFARGWVNAGLVREMSAM
ncbi:hypothetical protein J7T55_005542 [Diaporthe amygdali]|uniref:uncharacterized protein n=1 Tax=Phomopsis amygdali TaxID=1214568 RepID=UPI0022FDE3D0|nr:uncharacterized protein J7T55_005542 [Diaporthe amygdali]KAJ0108994.1 hypothetical protein J7T55_005542 [Diaporthe amygdali]